MLSEHSREILLVEDNDEDALITIRSLSKLNLIRDIIWLEDGQQALDHLFTATERDSRSVPKLILLDMTLPIIAGIEVLEQIKRSQLMNMVPVIIMTSSSEHADIKRAFELGVRTYLLKPVDFSGFTEAARQVGVLLNEEII